jgi:colanic acid biosynthesis glycosyl transferase WcaI
MNANPRSGKTSRVLIYAMNYTPELIGCGRYTGEIGDYLMSRGTPLTVVTTPPHYPGWAARDGYANRYVTETTNGATIIRCPVGLSKNMKGFGRIWAPMSFALSSMPVVMWRILKDRPTHVLCIEPTLMGAPAALLAAKCTGARTILHVQDLEMDAAFAVGHVKGGFVKSAAFAFEKVVLGLFDDIVTISHKMAEKLSEKGVPKDKLRLIRNWVDTSKIFPQRGPSNFRQELGLSPNDFIALYAGNIGVKQALNLVMDAAAQLVDTPIKFVIAGDGPEKTALIARNAPNVTFLPLQPEHRLNDLLNLADVHVLPQLESAADLVLPSKLGGILASGKALVAMADLDTELAIFLGNDAILVPPGDVTRMAEALKTLALAHDPQTPVQRTSKALPQLDRGRAMGLFAGLLNLGATETAPAEATPNIATAQV